MIRCASASSSRSACPTPRPEKDPYAVLQLRRDNANGTLYNLVGCQTHLKFGEQKRVFSMIPALRNAEFVRYGVMHRNTFIDSPRLLDATYALKSEPRIRFAGQMTGVEGYIESTASGWTAGVAAAMEVLGRPMPQLDRFTAVGALASYISDHTVTKFQPMNINFGIIEPLGYKIKGKREKNAKISERALRTHRKSEGRALRMKIIVDAMGGDNAPDVTVRGAALAAKEYGEDILLVGQPEAITAVLRAHGLENTEHLTIMPASDLVDMHDDPATVLRRKPDSSMAVAFKLLKAGEGDALVSAGNTGALLTGATLYGGRIKGIRRAALLAPVPPARAARSCCATPVRTPSARRKCCSSSPSSRPCMRRRTTD